MNFQIVLRIGQPNSAVLNSRLQRHCTTSKITQLRQLFIIQIPHGEIFKLRTFVLVLLPPDLSRTAVVGKQSNLTRLGTGFLDTALIRQTQLNPKIDAQMVVTQPCFRLVFRAQATRELQPFIGIFNRASRRGIMRSWVSEGDAPASRPRQETGCGQDPLR